jgi:hypothetical protein
MLEPAVQSALVILVAYLLTHVARALNLPLDEGTLYALAGAIVTWLLGLAVGSLAARGIRSLF